MKKADILVIALVLLLSIGFYVIYFSNNLITHDSLGVEVYYKNLLVYEQELKDDIEATVSIETKSGILIVKIDLDGDGEFEKIDEYTNVETDSREIYNVVHIEYGHIHMEEANCDNKLCLNMRIGKTLSTPIFCTNNVLVKLVTNDYKIITG
ncbi:MAG TPA: hypothetical protein GX740_05235 [Acholeplasmataceae bacterium]|jgi:hypothetical protein|nr:hypothetical protein [Acholeplasmataceae bacterium]